MKTVKLIGELLVTAGILLLIGAMTLIGTVMVPLIAFIGGVFILGVIIFFLVHSPSGTEKPTE